MPTFQKNHTLVSMTRAGSRKELTDLFLNEEPGNGNEENASVYEYEVEKTLLNETILIKRPTRSFGFDFAIHTPDLYFSNNKSKDRPKHEDVINILLSFKDKNPQSYLAVSNAINNIYMTNFFDKLTVSNLFFNYNNKSYSIELLLLTIRWMFLEQDITYWNYSGRNMLYTGLKNNSLC